MEMPNLAHDIEPTSEEIQQTALESVKKTDGEWKNVADFMERGEHHVFMTMPELGLLSDRYPAICRFFSEDKAFLFLNDPIKSWVVYRDGNQIKYFDFFDVLSKVGDDPIGVRGKSTGVHNIIELGDELERIGWKNNNKKLEFSAELENARMELQILLSKGESLQ